MLLTSFNKHILELKNRLILTATTWITTILSCYLFKETILYNIISTFQNFKTYFILTDVAELFTIYFKLTFFISNQFLLLTIFYQITMFLSTGLHKKELKKLKLINIIFFATLIISINSTQFIIVPIINKFFFQFQDIINNSITTAIFFEAKLKEYVNFYINIYLITAVNFLSFVIMLYIIQILSLNFKDIKKIRKLFYFIFLLFSTMVTPPDIISQLLLTVVLIGAYELLLIMQLIYILYANKEAN